MNRYRCETCCRETFGGKPVFCHGQMMADMGAWHLESKEITEAPMIVRAATYQYQCPITGREINGKRAHEENLARHGCRVLESGEAEDAARRRRDAEKSLDAALGSCIALIRAGMRLDQRGTLVKEITAAS